MKLDIANFLSKITLEPTVFALYFGIQLEKGARITTDLLINQVCHYEQNNTQEICASLTNGSFEGINDEVQEGVNDFLMISQWIGQTPSFLYSFFAGSLMDHFGTKLFILVPLIGMLIQNIFLIINCAFMESLPIEFFYSMNIFYIFGGKAVLYLGIYGFGTLTTQAKYRSRTLARYDGFENFGSLIGMVLSPVVYMYAGALTNYGVEIGCTTIAIIYTIIFIPNQSTSSTATQNKGASGTTFRDILVSPVIDMFQCLFRKRNRGLHWLIAIQICCHSIYWFTIYDFTEMRYLYLLDTMDGFTGSQYSYYSTYMMSLTVIALLFILPILSNYFKLHDALILTICVATEALSIFVIVFCVNMWQVYLASGLQILAFCKFSLVRSLLSKCVEPEETGKMFSVLAIFCALMPLLANSTFRPLYSWTLPIFPGAILIMAGSLLTISALLNLYLYTQRHRMVYDTSQQLIDNNNRKQSKNPSIRGRRNSFVTSM